MTSWDALASASGPAWAARALDRSVSAWNPARLIDVSRSYSALSAAVVLTLVASWSALAWAMRAWLATRGSVRRGEIVDVAGGVLDLLDLEGVHDDAEFLHLTVAAGDDFLGDPVAFADDLLDREPADDGAQVAREDPPDEFLHPVLFRQEAAGGVGDRHRVVTHLEHRNRANGESDALARDALLDDLRLPQRQRQDAGLLLDGRTKLP